MRLRRRLGLLAVAAVLSALLLSPAGVGPAQAADEPFVLGTGAASATVAKARLFYAGYSLQVALGLAATTYENSQSRALGSAYDLSAALSLVKVKEPALSPVSVDSNAGDAATARDLGAGPLLGRISLTAKRVPASTAEVRLVDVDLPGVLHVEGGRNRSSSSIVDGSLRRARAEVTVGSVSLLGGLIVLDGLRWEAVHETGASERSEASFSLEQLLLAGLPIATDLHDLDPVLDALNAALAPAGLVLTGPEVLHRDNGSIEITPLRVGILSSPLGAQAVAPLVAGIRPLLVPVYEALSQVDSTLGLAGLVADLGLGVADGSGGIELAVGGATALTDDAVFEDPLGGGGGLAPAPVTGEGGGGTTGSGGLGAPAAPTAPGTGSQVVRTASEGPARCVLEASPRRQGSCRGSNVPGAVAVVVLVTVAVGAYDVRQRRRLAPAAAEAVA